MEATLFFLISLVSLAIATFTDLRERIVSDKLTYSLIGGGLVLHFLFAVLNNNFETVFTVMIVTVVTFLFSYLLWKVGMWAGGDVKLFTALAVLNPVNYGVIRDFFGLNAPLFGSIALPVFPLTLFIFSILSMFPLAILITLKGIAKDKSLQKKIFADLKAKTVAILVSAILISGVLFLVSVLKISALLAIPILLAIGFFGKRVSFALGGILFAAGVALKGVALIWQFALLFLALVAIYLSIKLYLVAKSNILVEKTKIGQLEEGMISARTIVKENEQVKELEPLTMKSVINHFRNNNVAGLIELMQPKGKILASAASAGGLTKGQIKELKEAAKSRQIKDFLLVKKSVPFVPGVLIAYVVAQTVGDALWQVIF